MLSPDLRASNELFHRKDDADVMSVSDVNAVEVNSGILRLGASLRLDTYEREKSELHFKSQIFGEPSMPNMRGVTHNLIVIFLFVLTREVDISNLTKNINRTPCLSLTSSSDNLLYSQHISVNT